MDQDLSSPAVSLPERAEAGERRRILFFTPALGGGGAEKHLVRLANQLTEDEVTVAVIRGGGSYEGELRSEVSLANLRTRRMAAALAPLKRLIAELRPDIVCSFMDHANVTAAIATIGLPAPPRLVLGMQNTLHRRDGRRNGLSSRVVRWAIPRVYSRADAIVALSAGVRDDLLGVAPGLASSTHVIPNAGYDGDVERAALAELPSRVTPRPLLVACGRLTEQKGYPYLLRAFRKIVEVTPAHLWIIGDGPLRATLEREIEQLGLNERVWLAGFQENPYRFMRAADVFVLSSLWEGFGNVLVEAMACGSAVVSTDCPHGPGEIIRDGSSGLLVPPGDPDALATAILRLLRDPELRDRVAAAGKERSREFSAERSAELYSTLFSSLVGEPAGSAGFR